MNIFLRSGSSFFDHPVRLPGTGFLENKIKIFQDIYILIKSYGGETETTFAAEGFAVGALSFTAIGKFRKKRMKCEIKRMCNIANQISYN